MSEVYNVETSKKLASFTVKGSESTIISPDGSKVIIFGSEITSNTNQNYTSKGIYSIHNVDTGNLICRDDAKIIQNNKIVERFLAVFNEGGFNSKNISVDLSLIARIYTFQPSDKSVSRPALIIGNLKNNSAVNEFRTNDGFLSGDIWGNVVLTPNGKYVAAYRYNRKNQQRNKSIVWDVKTGEVIFDLPFYKVESLSDNGKRVVVKNTGRKDQIEIWDIQSGKRVSALTEIVNGKDVKISRGIISADGRILATTGDEEFYFWDAETGKVTASQRQNNYDDNIVKSVTFSGDGKRIAVGNDAEIVTVWSIDDILKGENQIVSAK